MQFRSGLKLLSVFTMATLALAQIMVPVVRAGGITSPLFTIVDDSTDGTTFYIGDNDITAEYDIDTSITYDSRYWDDLTVSLKTAKQGAGSGTPLDSGAITFVLQQSNDSIWWTPTDSIVAVDTLAVFKDMAPQRYRWSRFIAHKGAKASNIGVQGVASARAWGQW